MSKLSFDRSNEFTSQREHLRQPAAANMNISTDLAPKPHVSPLLGDTLVDVSIRMTSKRRVKLLLRRLQYLLGTSGSIEGVLTDTVTSLIKRRPYRTTARPLGTRSRER